MATDRLVKWSKEAKCFFESAADNSIVLDIVISYSCASQTGEGFEELVNSLNSEDIKRKIKKVIITDTSYLYRHTIPDFAKYSDPDIPTIWFLNNQDTIKKLTVDTELKSWVSELNTDEFKNWHKKIITDFEENKEFRDLVVAEATIAAYKKKGTYEDNIKFILEECAYICIYIQNVVYPIPFSPSFRFVIKRYAKVRQLCYDISREAQHNVRKFQSYDISKINEKILSLINDVVSNVNFFVIDKNGDYIYQNKEFCKVAGNVVNAKNLDSKSWGICKEVMKSCKQLIVEEQFPEGVYYISVKVPLIINDKVEGVIGLAVDMTDRKRAERLEIQNKLYEKTRIIAEQVAHDIRSPLAALSMLIQYFKGLSEKERTLLKSIASNIKNIADDLLEKYSKNDNTKDIVDRTEEDYVSLYWCLNDIVNSKRYQYQEKEVVFNYYPDLDHKFAFMKGNFSNFCRMMSNLINNSVEALEDKKGIIDVSFRVKDGKVEIRIKDNGKGMSSEMIAKIMNYEKVDTTKKKGYGIGMQQIRSTLKEMKGQMQIESTENVGTEIKLIFPESNPPKFFTDKIVLHKGDTVIVLDDDTSVHDVWKKRFEDYAKDITIKYFSDGLETIDFINSVKEKDKVFLLADYELRNQGINGIDVIERSGMQNRSILVTSAYLSQIKNFNEKCKFIKILPKLYINDISIILE